MKSTLRWVMWLTLASVIGAIVIATVGMAWLQAEMPGEVLTFNSEQIAAGDFTARHWLLAVLGLSAALMVMLTVVPLTLAFALLVAGGAVGFALVVALSALAWATAPVWIVIALLWWALRSRRPRPAAT